MEAKLLGNAGIYCIWNVSNGKRYIGSTINLCNRITWHKGRLDRGKHNNQYLQRAYNESPHTFLFIIVERVITEASLLNREQYWLDLYKSYIPQYGYNICPVAGRTAGIKGQIPWTKGKKLGPLPNVVTKKISLALRGHPCSEETRRKISEANMGKVGSLKGIPKSEETRKKLSIANKGKPLSAEHIQKMRDAWKHRTRIVSAEQRQKLSIATKNWWNRKKMVTQQLIESANPTVNGDLRQESSDHE